MLASSVCLCLCLSVCDTLVCVGCWLPLSVCLSVSVSLWLFGICWLLASSLYLPWKTRGLEALVLAKQASAYERASVKSTGDRKLMLAAFYGTHANAFYCTHTNAFYGTHTNAFDGTHTNRFVARTQMRFMASICFLWTVLFTLALVCCVHLKKNVAVNTSRCFCVTSLARLTPLVTHERHWRLALWSRSAQHRHLTAGVKLSLSLTAGVQREKASSFTLTCFQMASSWKLTSFCMDNM